MKKSILLTGATGFLGSHLLESLLKTGYAVTILKRSTSDTRRINHLLGLVKAYDVDRVLISKAFEDRRIDAVIHTACHYGRNDDPISSVVETNLMFGLRLLETATFFNAETFFNTDTLLQKNLNAYTLSKKNFVEWLQELSGKIQVVNLKLEHMYGPGDDANKFVQWAIGQLSGGVSEIPLTPGEQQRDFVYIDDVVSAYLLTLQKVEGLGTFTEFDVGTGHLVSIREFLQLLKSVFEERCWEVQTGLKLGAVPYRDGEIMCVEVDNRALKELGWTCRVELDEGLRITVGEAQ